MMNDDKVKLWESINAYVVACGGDPARHVYGNAARQNAVSEVEREALGNDPRRDAPAWLTDAVLWALPADGTPLKASAVNGIPASLLGSCMDYLPDGETLNEAMIGHALAALVSSGAVAVVSDRDGLTSWHRATLNEGADPRQSPTYGQRTIAELATRIAETAHRYAMANNWDGAENALLGIAREAREIVALDEDAAKRGPFVPHAVVHQHLAERAYAEDARFLFDVYQAAMRVKEQRDAHEPSYDDPIGDLCALLDSKVPAEPAERSK